MHTKLKPTALAVVSLLSLSASQSARAARVTSSTTVERAKALAEERNLHSRVVEAGPSFGRVKRFALEMRNEQDWAAVVDRLGLRLNPETGKYQGSLIFRQIGQDMAVVVPEGMGLGNNRALDPSQAKTMASWSPIPPGSGVVVHLSPEQADHVGRWLAARGSDKFFRAVGNGCSDMMMNIEVEPAPDGTHTLRAISDDEALQTDLGRKATLQQSIPGTGVAMGTTVAIHTGVRASKQGSQMLMKWLWSGNRNVAVALVFGPSRIKSVTREVGERLASGAIASRKTAEWEPLEFDAMSDDALLGPQHSHGVDGAARRPVSPEKRQHSFDLASRIRKVEAQIAETKAQFAAAPPLAQAEDRLRLALAAWAPRPGGWHQIALQKEVDDARAQWGLLAAPLSLEDAAEARVTAAAYAAKSSALTEQLERFKAQRRALIAATHG